MKLSIIIPTFDTAETTFKCVQSIKQHLKINFEIILVDNHSSDNTVSLLKNEVDQLIANSANLGFAKANNLGAARASGDFLLFLNSDMLFIDNSFDKMLNYLISDTTIGVIGPQFLNPDYSPQPSVFPPQGPVSAFKQYWLGLSAYEKYIPSEICDVFAISGGAILLRCDFFQHLGCWNEQYFFYYEDLDLCRAVHRLHYRVVFFPECRLIHYHGLSGKNLADPSNQWRRLIRSSIIYRGYINHYLTNFIIWSGQKRKQLLPF